MAGEAALGKADREFIAGRGKGQLDRPLPGIAIAAEADKHCEGPVTALNDPLHDADRVGEAHLVGANERPHIARWSLTRLLVSVPRTVKLGWDEDGVITRGLAPIDCRTFDLRDCNYGHRCERTCQA